MAISHFSRFFCDAEKPQANSSMSTGAPHLSKIYPSTSYPVHLSE